MVDLEYQAHRLGIPIQTRHNEVAPGQYEFAPMFDRLMLLWITINSLWTLWIA